MKKVADVFKGLVILVLVAVIAAAGCLAAIFAVSKDDPEDIFLFGYAMVNDEDAYGKRSFWLIKQTGYSELENGTGVVYYNNDSYCSANIWFDVGGMGDKFVSLDPETRSCDILPDANSDNIVGEIVAMWQFGG